MSRRVAVIILETLNATNRRHVVSRRDLTNAYALSYPETDRPRSDRRRGSSGSRAAYLVQVAVTRLERAGLIRRFVHNGASWVRVVNLDALLAIAAGDATVMSTGQVSGLSSLNPPEKPPHEEETP